MIDWSRIRDLRDEIGQEDFGEILDLFLEEVEEVIHRLSESPNAATLEADFHFLKGSALNLGFSEFCRHCQAGEHEANTGGDASAHIGPVVDAFFVSKAEFLSNLDAKLAA